MTKKEKQKYEMIGADATVNFQKYYAQSQRLITHMQNCLLQMTRAYKSTETPQQ